MSGIHASTRTAVDLSPPKHPDTATAVAVKHRHTPLQVGLLVESMYQPEWIRNVIRDIRSSGTSDIAAVILREVPAAGRRNSIGLVSDSPHSFLYSLYSTLDRLVFGTGTDPLTIADISPLLDGCRRLKVGANENRDTGFGDDDLKSIRAARLDVLLDFGSHDLPRGVRQMAKYGVWTYRHGDDGTAKSSVGIWEVLEEQPVTSLRLCALSGQSDREKILYQSSGRTHPRSVLRNRTSALAKASAFTTRKLRELYEDGPSALETQSIQTGEAPRVHRNRSLPTNHDMIAFLSRLAFQYTASRLSYYQQIEQWFLTFNLQQSDAGRYEMPGAVPHRMTRIIPPKDRFWADPFPVKKEGGYYVFFEERPTATRKGFLSVLEISDSGSVGPATKVLERDYHLSYPFVFDWQGDYYMIPESGANKTVELYRATEFPYRWELDRVLLKDISAVDATIHHFANRWWMFVNIALPGASSCDELHIYHADCPLGPWLPHRRNPVKSDARNARPAGRIFAQGGNLFRPAQDCSIRYGGSIIINKITRLDLDGFDEVEISTILPDWQPDLVATHTINAVDRLTVMDAKWMRPRWKKALRVS